ncbi:MarR family winged helix-turn-helix transcriptional regulator [Rhizorhabdus phycosphaerae]|uniref:MarR family winged helix-turn-helix transcriptional regulator n=1 Tax=Rhizorhabdus phycosphaerae TaxID=2711156 RepID=UPI0013EC2274|nr:MarR family transcriptional regulator [Rhizorhabdus phycosphaerae]
MHTEPNRRISFLTHDIARRSRYWFDARARSRGITRPQWRVLISLAAAEGPTQSELAEMLDVERITLCRMVDRLAEAGLVERRADPADRRVWRIHLTDRAAPIVSELSDIASTLEERVLAPLTTTQRETLSELLSIVRDHIREEDERTANAPRPSPETPATAAAATAVPIID